MLPAAAAAPALAVRAAKAGSRALLLALGAGATAQVLSCGRSSLYDLPYAPGGGDDAGEDARLPLIDAGRSADVERTHCAEAGTQYVYVVTSTAELYSFDPAARTFASLGTLRCPTPSASPFSMAVDRSGSAYVLYDDGELFRVSLVTARCEPTAYTGTPYVKFGMGFAGNADGTADTLYIAPADAGLLATIDLATFHVTTVGPFAAPEGELAGTGDGRLFTFYAIDGMASSAVAQVDPTTARLVASDDLTGLPLGYGWAFGYWGGDFYLFTTAARGGPSTVTRFRPGDRSQETLASFPGEIVGAGVSTCAPQF